MKIETTSTKYAVKYELLKTHTGRVHETMDSAIRDLAQCQKSATRGVGDEQAITLVAVEGESWRHLNEAEMDAFSKRAFDLGIEC